VAVILCVALYHSPAIAGPDEDEGVWFPRSEAADLLGRASEQATLQRTIEAQEKIIASLERIVQIQGRLVDLAEQESAAHERLAALAGKERDVYRDKADKGQGWLRCRANAGVAALVGAGAGSVFPGIGTLAGGAFGAIGGCIAGFAGAP
jgi:hypothetical protein